MKKCVFFLALALITLPLSANSGWMTKRLTWTPSYSNCPAVATDSNDYIHVVWHDRSPGTEEIFYTKSTDGGTNWASRRLTWNSGASYQPVIAIDSNDHIHVAWMDETPGKMNVFYKKSTDGGTSWSTQQLTQNSSWTGEPAIAIDSNDHIHLVLYDYVHGNAEVSYMKSTNGGVSWSTKRLTWSSGASRAPEVSTDTNNHIYVVWYDTSPGNGEIYFKKSTDGGLSWATKRLTMNSGNSEDPVIAIDSNNHIHVFWCDYSFGDVETLTKKSTDGGTSWTTKRLTWTSDHSPGPSVAIDSNDYIHLVWVEYSFGNLEICYKTSTDGGTTWGLSRLTWNSGISSNPYITTDTNNRIHVVWSDATPGNTEIFYKKKD